MMGSCRCRDRTRWSRQGEPALEPQVLAVPCGGLVEGFGLWGCQGPVGPQVEPHVVVGDGAPHGGEELRVDQGHSSCALPGARHVAGCVEQPAGVLVAAVHLVEDLEKVACGFWGPRGGSPGACQKVRPSWWNESSWSRTCRRPARTSVRVSVAQ